MPVDQRLAGLTVTVAGSGIGGLATAVALRRHGAAVTVLERAPRPEAAGAGLSLWPNAVHALRALGVASDLEAVGVPRGAGGLWRWDGRPLASQDAVELEERYGAPLLLVHRAELLAALLAALPGDAVIAGDALRSFDEDADGVSARFASGRTVRSDLLVGADGLRSVVRRGLLGDEEPRASGLVAYRGVVRHPVGDRAGEFWGPGGVVGLAPLSGGRVYWYATAPAFPGDRGPVSHAEHVRLVARLSGWAEPIRSVVAATPADSVLRHPLEDRRPKRGWSSAHVTLVGDAAHPMLPFLGQGACQALEDAVSLPAALLGTDSLTEGLHAYEQARHARTAPLVKRARSAGKVAHLTHRWQRDLRDGLVRRASAGMRRRQLDAVLAWEE